MIKPVPRRYGAPRQRALGVVGDPQESAGSEEPDGKGDEALRAGRTQNSNILLGCASAKHVPSL
jgi:hypothetical protein